PLDLQVHLAPGQLRQGGRGQQRRSALAQRHDVLVRDLRQALPVLANNPAPYRPGGTTPRFPPPEIHSPSSPSTRRTLSTAFTASMADRSATVSASADSLAVWVTMISDASSPRPSWC